MDAVRIEGDARQTKNKKDLSVLTDAQLEAKIQIYSQSFKGSLLHSVASLSGILEDLAGFRAEGLKRKLQRLEGNPLQQLSVRIDDLSSRSEDLTWAYVNAEKSRISVHGSQGGDYQVFKEQLRQEKQAVQQQMIALEPEMRKIFGSGK